MIVRIWSGSDAHFRRGDDTACPSRGNGPCPIAFRSPERYLDIRFNGAEIRGNEKVLPEISQDIDLSHGEEGIFGTLNVEKLLV